ncbi:MAG: hypothetical protein C4K47_06230 [Candidatus Thorarchaeota archaeon]|nr:MAG: hypothetical protein C4K47_06230 [Candidatus Thorarchaeota archaeon]
MRFESLPLREANLAELAKVSYDARHDTVLSYKARTISEAAKRLNDIVSKGKECVVIEARDESKGTVGGFLELFMIIRGIAQTDWWQPVVSVTSREGKIARCLIEQAKSYARESGRDRIEAAFDMTTPNQRSLLRKYWRWYSSEGFQKASEEFRMRSLITETALHHRELPSGYSLVSAASVDKEEIRDCYLKSFSESMDRLILSMNAQQRRSTFDTCLDPSDVMDQEASLCIQRDRQVVAFVLVGTERAESLIELLGVDPEFRRLGLGGTILAESMYALLHKGTREVDIEVDVKNTPALRLYRKMGFAPLYRQAYYYTNL